MSGKVKCLPAIGEDQNSRLFGVTFFLNTVFRILQMFSKEHTRRVQWN